MSFSSDERENTPEPRISEACLNLDNQFLSMQELSKAEGMRVYARVRPMLNSEIEAGFKECFAAIDDQTVRAVVPSTSAKYRSTSQGTQDIIQDFTFTSAFGPETGQFVFFQECIMNTMLNFIEGQNSLVFSYGSTGSGKTFTLQGNPENPGIIPLSLHLFFATLEDQLLKKAVVKPDKFADIIVLSENDRKKEMQLKEQLTSISEQEEWSSKSSSKSFAMVLCDTFSEKSEVPERQTTLGPEEMAQAQAATLMKELSKRSAEQQSGVCNIWVSFAEIYNENVYDLLQPNITQRNKLNLGEDKNGDVYVKGLQEVCVSNCYEALKLLTLGQKNLKIASTKLNYQSSRSHCIFTVKVIRIPDAENITYAKVNRLSFCDLAGSERAAKSQTTGIRLKEAGCINTSLLVLGRCLEQLRSNPNLRDKKLIPFRESKLTRLFSGFFTGKGKAMMVINASPSELTFDETLHVLRFSAIAKELIINDSYIATASNTLQTITNMWTNARANRSNNSSDRSISFEDSMEELQEKDELIEKLLDLAESLRNNLENEKKEKAELEIKIRQEVYQDYSKYSDELLENQKQAYEEECEAIKEIYKKRISSMEKMYENIISDYKAQLEESDSSEDEAYDVSKIGESVKKESKVESETSPKKMLEDLVKTEISENETNLGKESDNLVSEIEALKTDLWNVTEELKATKKELQKVVDHATSLESVSIELEKKLEIADLSLQEALNENDELKKRNDDLQTSYEEEIMKLVDEKESSSVLLNESEIKVKYDAAQVELQSTPYKREEMMKEYEALKIDRVFYETDNKDLQKAKSVLEEKLQSLIDELAAVKAEKQSFQEKCVELENKTETIDAVLKELAVVKNEKQSIEEKCKELEDKIASHNDEVSNLNSIIDELNELRNNLQAEYEMSLTEAEKKFLDVNSNLNAAYLELEEEKKKSNGFENDMALLKQNLTDLQNKNQNNLETIDAVSKELAAVKTEKQSIQEERMELENKIAIHKDEVQKLNAVIDELNELQKESQAEYEKSLNEAEKKFLDANNNLNAAYLELEEEKKKSDSLENDLSLLKQNLVDLQSNNLKNVETVNSISKELDDTRIENTNLNARLAEAENSITSLTKSISDLKDELNELNRKKLESEQHLKCSLEEAAEAALVLEAANKALNCATMMTEERDRKIGSLETECDTLKYSISVLEEKYATAVKDFDELVKIKDDLEKKYATANEECAGLTHIKEDLEENNAISTNELADLMRMKEKVEEKYASATRELEIKKSTETPEQAKTSKALHTVEEQAEDIRSLIAECMRLKEEISALQQTNLDLNNKLSASHESLNLEQTAFSKRIEEAENVIKDLKENIVKSEQEINNLKNIEKEKEQLRENIERELHETKEKLASSSQELKDASDNIQKQIEEIDSLKTEISVSKNYISELKEAEMELKKQITNLSQNLESKEVSHKQELDALNTKLEEGLSVISKQEKDLEVIQNYFNNQKNEIAALTQQKQEFEKKLNSQPQIDVNGDLLMQDVDSLNARLDEALNTIESQKKELEILQTTCAAHKEEISQLEILKKEPQLDALLLKLVQVLQECEKKATIRIENLEERAELDKCCIDACEKECDELRSVVDILQNIEHFATKRIKELHSSSIKHVDQIMDLERTIKAKEGSIESLKNDYTALQKQLKDFQVSSKKQLQTEKQQLTTEIEGMKKLRKDLEKENKEMKSKSTQLQTQKQLLISETEDMKKLKIDVERENKDLKFKLTKLEEEKNSLFKEVGILKNLQNKLSTKRKSSTPQLEEKEKLPENENGSQTRSSRRKSNTPQKTDAKPEKEFIEELKEKGKQSEIENENSSQTRSSRRKSKTPQTGKNGLTKKKPHFGSSMEPLFVVSHTDYFVQIAIQKTDAKSEKEFIEEAEVVKKSKDESENLNSQEKSGKEENKLKSSTNKVHAKGKPNKGSFKKADNIEEKQKENTNQTRALRKLNRIFSEKADNIEEKQKQRENANNQETKENRTESALKERKLTRRQLRNLENVPVAVDLILKDSNAVKSKSSKRKLQDNSSEEKSPMNKLLKKIKLNDVENISKPQNLRLQVLKGEILKTDTSQPSPRLTRGRKRLFNSELFQSKENTLENKSRRAVRW